MTNLTKKYELSKQQAVTRPRQVALDTVGGQAGLTFRPA